VRRYYFAGFLVLMVLLALAVAGQGVGRPEILIADFEGKD
jgi:hypothetical protein